MFCERCEVYFNLKKAERLKGNLKFHLHLNCSINDVRHTAMLTDMRYEALFTIALTNERPGRVAVALWYVLPAVRQPVFNLSN